MWEAIYPLQYNKDYYNRPMIFIHSHVCFNLPILSKPKRITQFGPSSHTFLTTVAH